MTPVPATATRIALHAIGKHHYGPWMWVDATYSAGPLMRAIMRKGPTQWVEPVQIRQCHICKLQKIRRFE